MGFCELRIKLDRPGRRGHCPFQVGRVAAGVQVLIGVAVGEPGVGAGVGRVDGDRPLEELAGESDAPFVIQVEELAAAQVILKGVDVAGRGLPQGVALSLAQGELESLDDPPGDLVLDGEDVLDVTVVAVGPQPETVGRVDELN